MEFGGLKLFEYFVLISESFVAAELGIDPGLVIVVVVIVIVVGSGGGVACPATCSN